MPRRRVVMISSTARDLPKHRDQVRLACERAGFEPREMMENLPALNKDAVEASLRMVEQADIYLGILAYRYGTVPTGHDLSITEMEFNRAFELNRPRLIFFVHRDHPVVIDDVETGSGASKLQALKNRIGEARVAAFFKSPDDLRAHVAEALNALAKELDAPETGDSIARTVAQPQPTTSILAPSEQYITHVENDASSPTWSHTDPLGPRVPHVGYITVAEAIRYMAYGSEWGGRIQNPLPGEPRQAPLFAAAAELARRARNGELIVYGRLNRSGIHQTIS